MYQRYVLRSELNEILATGAIMAAGVSGGQTLYGGTGSGETLAIYSTTNETKTGIIIDGMTFGRGRGGISGNTAIGYQSLYSNTTGKYNTATGYQSLYSNTTGEYNTATGYQSLYSNTTGLGNTAMGFLSLNGNIGGDNNVAVGYRSLYSNTTGGSSVATGVRSLYSNTTGGNNTAIGYQSLYSNTTGGNNTAIGYQAGLGITIGVNVMCLGYYAQPSAVDATNQITLGNSNITSLRCAVSTITAISDARDKTAIVDLPLGLEFILALKPRKFTWKKRMQNEDGSLGDPGEVGADDVGFVAQELDEIQDKYSAAWMGIVMKDNPDRWETTPGKLLPIAIKAIQELAAKVELLEQKLV